MKKKSVNELAANATEKTKGFFADFKAFITKGSVLDMAVGVIIGGAFNAIVTALVNILLSLCTWGVPGGIKGLVTVLPAANAAQAGVTTIGQSFEAADLVKATAAYAATQGVENLKSSDPSFISWQQALLSKYSIHGTTYYYNASAIIDWGTFINAIISFLIIGFTLFVIVRTIRALDAKRLALAEKAKASFEKDEAEEAVETPAPVVPAPAPAPTEMDVLNGILSELKKMNEAKPDADAK